MIEAAQIFMDLAIFPWKNVFAEFSNATSLTVLRFVGLPCGKGIRCRAAGRGFEPRPVRSKTFEKVTIPTVSPHSRTCNWSKTYCPNLPRFFVCLLVIQNYSASTNLYPASSWRATFYTKAGASSSGRKQQRRRVESNCFELCCASFATGADSNDSSTADVLEKRTETNNWQFAGFSYSW